ncbi:MAG: hypothetical protein ACJ76H_06920 [Bacteriovoracaceae bacterium]
MKSFFFLLLVLPQFAFAGTVLLTLSAEHLSKLKLPGDVVFESTNVFCEERGLTPQPWSAPRKQTIQPKIVSVGDHSVVLEITTSPKKQDICKYKFSDFRVWSDDGAYFISIEAATESNRRLLDAADLDLTTNHNSHYLVECAQKNNLQKNCTTFKDGVKKGYSSGNGANLTIDLQRLEKEDELRAEIEYRKK